MTGKMKILLCIVLSFMTCFLSIGYAAVSTELNISGDAQYYLPPLYISNVEWIDGTGVLDSEDHAVDTTLDSTLRLASNASSNLVLAVTVKNRTNDIYGYSGTTAESGSYSNNNITYGIYSNEACTTRLAKKTELHPETTAEGEDGLTFYVEFSYKAGYKPSSTEELRSLLSFHFQTPIDSIIDDSAVSNAVDKFYDILNDHINDKDYHPLIDIMNTGNRDRNISYVGNVAGADPNDITEVENLFDGQLKVNIEGEEKEVKFLLKRENIDGKTETGGQDVLNYRDNNGDQRVTGWEMVMYMTTEDLVRDKNWLGLPKTTYKTVYAIVFTSYDGGITWEQLGEMYQGEAQVVRYDGWNGDGSFTTDKWRSTKVYYGVPTGSSIEALLEKIPKK